MQFFFQQVHALALFIDVGFVLLRRSEERGRQFFADRSRHALHQFLRELGLLVDGKPEAQAKLGIVFEKRVRPGRSAACCVFRPRRGGQVAAVNRRASGGVGDDGPVAEQLRHQLEIWSFAATGAGAGELEQRFLNLLLADVGDFNVAAVQFRNLEEEIPVLALGHAQRRLRHHVDRLQPGFGLVLDRTDFDADAAAGAVFRRYLNRVLEALPFFVAGLGGLESRRRALQFFGVVNLDADDRVRTNHGALSALDADLRIPGRDFERQVALLPFRGSGGEGAVDGKCADRQFVAASGIDHAQHVALEFRRRRRKRRRHLNRAGEFGRDFHFEQVRQSLVHGFHVLLYDLFALLAVGVANRFANRLNRLIAPATPWRWRRSRPAESCSCGCPCRCRAPLDRRRSRKTSRASQ